LIHHAHFLTKENNSEIEYNFADSLVLRKDADTTDTFLLAPLNIAPLYLMNHQTSILGSLIEPIMIIFLGLIVAIILIAMYLPLFQMSSAIH